jgi:hypothetical protein
VTRLSFASHHESTLLKLEPPRLSGLRDNKKAEGALESSPSDYAIESVDTSTFFNEKPGKRGRPAKRRAYERPL